MLGKGCQIERFMDEKGNVQLKEWTETLTGIFNEPEKMIDGIVENIIDWG